MNDLFKLFVFFFILDIESFINMNIVVVFGLSGGVVLFVVIIFGVVICCIRSNIC